MSRKPYWHDILNDSSIFETKINKGNYNLDASTLKLLPIILRALNSNLIFDNEIDDVSLKPLSDKTAVNDDSYLESQKSTFTNWLRTPNTIDYRPHYKSPTNLDYYSKIRKIRNYQKVLSLFDKMINNKMSMTSSELTVEELTDKPKASRESKEFEKKKTTFSTRHHLSQPRRVMMVRKVTQTSTTKKKTTTATKQRETIMTNEKKCSCPKNIKILLNKVVHSIQEVLPELSLMVKVPCNDSVISATSKPSTTSTSTPTTMRTSTYRDTSLASIEDDDITPTQLIAVSTVQPLTTISPKKYLRSFLKNNKPKKHVAIEPYNNIYFGVPMQKLNIKPFTKRKLNLDKQKTTPKSSTKNRRQYNDTTEIFVNQKLFTTPRITLPVFVRTTKMSPISTTTTSTKRTISAKPTTSATTSARITTVAKITNTPTKRNQNIKVLKTIETTIDTNILAEDDNDEYYLTTPQEATIIRSSFPPQELSDFSPHILELIKSNILRSRPKKKIPAAKESNTYPDHVLENSSVQQTNANEESNEELNINTLEQPLTTAMHTNEVILNSSDSINAYQQISNKQPATPSLNDYLNLRDKDPTLPSLEQNLIKSMSDKDLRKNTTNYISKYTGIHFSETTQKYKSMLSTFSSSNNDNNFEINTATVTSDSDKVEIEKTILLESKSDETNIVKKDETNKNMLEEFPSYEGLLRKKGKLKGNEYVTFKKLTKKVSKNDRKSSALSNAKGETQKELNNYMNWLENVGHPVNVITSNWMENGASSSNKQKHSNLEVPWYIKQNDKSTLQTNNETRKVKTSTWSYDLFREDNKTSTNCTDKEDVKVEIEMPDSENLMPVQEIPLSKYSGNPHLPDTLNMKIDVFPDKHFNLVDNSPRFLKSMLPHNRPIYLEIARRDWKKDVKEYDFSKETYTDMF